MYVICLILSPDIRHCPLARKLLVGPLGLLYAVATSFLLCALHINGGFQETLYHGEPKEILFARTAPSA